MAPGFTRIAGVVTGFPETLAEVFGPEAGGHALRRGMAGPPFSVAV